MTSKDRTEDPIDVRVSWTKLQWCQHWDRSTAPVTSLWPGPGTHSVCRNFSPRGFAVRLIRFTRRIGDEMISYAIRRRRESSSFCLHLPIHISISDLTNRTTSNQTSRRNVTMKFFIPTLPLITVLAALSQFSAGSTTPDGNLVARDVCPPGFPSYCRSTGSPCAASNRVHEFCSCDRTNIVSE